jgi:AhpD family alkylhydroperoxidase
MTILETDSMHEASYPALTQPSTSSWHRFASRKKATMAGFGAMAKAAMAPGLSEKHKELIALGIGVSQRCQGCVAFHVKALRRLGATKAELEEVLAVAVYMGGGPSLMYAAEALQAWAIQRKIGV